MPDKLWVMTEQESQNLLLKVRPALYYSEQQVYDSRWKIGNRDSEGESFRVEYIVAAFTRYKRYGFSYVFVMRVGGLHGFNKNVKVYIYM